MADTLSTGETTAARTAHPKRNLWLKITGGSVLVLVVLLGLAAEYTVRHAEPALKASVVDTISARFHSPVELDRLSISLVRGVEVRGSGLRILYLAGPNEPANERRDGKTVPPMLVVRDFMFRVSLHDLLRLRARVARVTVQGLEVRIPPHSGHAILNPEQAKARPPRIHLVFGKIECGDARLIIETDKPGKDPLVFDIKSLELTDAGIDQPMLYTADVINPRPVGDVHAFGHIGPWQGADPRSTPIDGHFLFEHAELGSIKGLGGTLSATGEFNGQLGHINIDGTTDTPDFSLDVSNHPEPLLTHFQAFVDGTTGDTTLTNVQAKLKDSEFTTAGSIVRVHDPAGRGEGHDISLSVEMAGGHIQDLLQLGMKTEPPVMRGVVALRAKLHIPPGDVRVAQKMQIAGDLRVQSVEFTNAKLQDRIDGLSLRAQGKPQEVKAVSHDGKAEVASQMSIDFTLANAVLLAKSLRYQVPGAQVQLAGVYSLDGKVFEFRGHVRTEATASQMVSGWKSTLIRPFDGLLKKNGAGVELPIAVSGASGDVKFGLAMHGADETAEQIAADVRAKQEAQASSR